MSHHNPDLENNLVFPSGSAIFDAGQKVLGTNKSFEQTFRCTGVLLLASCVIVQVCVIDHSLAEKNILFTYA